MKNLNIYIALIMAMPFFIACSDSYLEVENPNNLDAAKFWKTEDDFQKGLVATYGALQLEGMLGGGATSQLPVRSDLGRPNNWNTNAQSLHTLTFNENTDIVKDRWQTAYIGIYRANQVLENIENSDIDELTKNHIIAQARFLRGFFYYSLYRGYNKGSVIIHTTTPKVREDFYKKPSPAAEVYALIEADLIFAKENLPRTYFNSKDYGRVTWGAATAMLGKLYINEHDYLRAQENFKEVIDSGLYSLTAHIGDNFDIEHEFNEESIFEVAFSVEAKPGTSNGAADGPLGSEGTSRARSLGSSYAGGYRVIMPSYHMTMLFMNDKMDPTNPINADRTGTADYSIRASHSIAISNDDNTTLYQTTSDKGGTYNNQEASYMKKFQNWKDEKESELNVSGINERVIRYADILLLYAECLLEQGIDFTTALDLVNQIRNRAGVVLLNAADYDVNSLMEHIMWTERPLELMFEGHDARWDDLRRWGKIKENYERLSQIQYVLNKKVLELYDPNDGNQTGLNPFTEFGMAASNYDPEVHDYFPIPSTELTSNPFFFED